MDMGWKAYAMFSSPIPAASQSSVVWIWVGSRSTSPIHLSIRVAILCRMDMGWKTIILLFFILYVCRNPLSYGYGLEDELDDIRDYMVKCRNPLSYGYGLEEIKPLSFGQFVPRSQSSVVWIWVGRAACSAHWFAPQESQSSVVWIWVGSN